MVEAENDANSAADAPRRMTLLAAKRACLSATMRSASARERRGHCGPVTPNTAPGGSGTRSELRAADAAASWRGRGARRSTSRRGEDALGGTTGGRVEDGRGIVGAFKGCRGGAARCGLVVWLGGAAGRCTVEGGAGESEADCKRSKARSEGSDDADCKRSKARSEDSEEEVARA